MIHVFDLAPTFTSDALSDTTIPFVCEIATVVVFVKFFCLCVESKIETKTLMFGKALKIHLFDSTCEIV